MWVYYVIVSVSCYMIQSPVVAIFMEVFFEAILLSMLKQFIIINIHNIL